MSTSFISSNRTIITQAKTMEKTLPLEERSINQIYLEREETKTYLIPIYQRNYAWEEDEIRALIKDVYDMFHKGKDAPYYIGTLVTYRRGDNVYEVIDGQQRLTTIYIILNVLDVKNIKNKLTYGARKASAATIQRLGDFSTLGDDVDKGIQKGYMYAEKAVSDIVGKAELTSFKQYFLDKVKMIHYEVPKDVDLNHYFEVMNSRGEQLEKHEIVKSTLCDLLQETEMATFSRIWEACSEMNKYIQQVFRDKSIFGDALSSFQIDSFEEITPQGESDGKLCLSKIMTEAPTDIECQEGKEQHDKFQPIIDFPNFLLIVLKLTRLETENGFNYKEFILDDKELLNEFDKALEMTADKAGFARRFAFNLLKAKYFLDNYIVHHNLLAKENVGDNPWALEYFLESSNTGFPKNLSVEQNVQDELVHLLSMFEVTFTPRQRKNYLFYCLLFLFRNNNLSVRDYLAFVRKLADKYFYDVYLNSSRLSERNQPLPSAFDDALLDGADLNMHISGNSSDYRNAFESIYRKGSADISLFVFNYTDYRLWKKYADELRGQKTKQGDPVRRAFFESLGCSDFDLTSFHFFYFSRTRKSLEHFYPQAKTGEGQSLSLYDINNFGNFAIISANANSSGSNWDPKTKLDHYTDKKMDQIGVASLKFKVMMQMCKDNLFASQKRDAGMEWNPDDMQKHQEKILDIVIGR